ncbi:MAG: hypothetical protein OEW58_02900 [Gammaproteobacteria bacterium]|nr:hypothetical protein [Gammaproteobacteria bacterium]
MGLKFDQPLYSLSDEQTQNEALKLWEAEKHGGLSEGNNRIPLPVTFLMALIILTAFMITLPIWGQRPTAAIYEDYVKLMDSPEVQRLATPEEKMAYVANTAYQMSDSKRKGELERHPLQWDDLLNLAPHIKEVQAGGGQYGMNEYTVLGDRLTLANFEGNFKGESAVLNGMGSGAGSGVRTRAQPWWDIGFTIDVFYVSYFCLLMVLVIKRLPHFSRKPKL